ncbi:hypothetical protein ACJX0J_035323, partial [Zea mays]
MVWLGSSKGAGVVLLVVEDAICRLYTGILFDKNHIEKGKNGPIEYGATDYSLANCLQNHANQFYLSLSSQSDQYDNFGLFDIFICV